MKLIVFDLDGTLTDSRELHYEALNCALNSVDPKYAINRAEHLSTYDGLSTSKKLKLLTQNKGLCSSLYTLIWEKKQKYTWDIVSKTYTYDVRMRHLLESLKNDGYLIYVASNCVYNTIKLILMKSGLLEFIDFFISNEDVTRCKPNPEIYFKCMIRAGVGITDTLIVEDSHIGIKAAKDSGAYVLPVQSPDQLTLKVVREAISRHSSVNIPHPMWRTKCSVVIPMAGEGSRFKNAGYTFPKPLIDVHGKPMIQLVVENLGIDPVLCDFIFIVRKQHSETYHVGHLLNLISPRCRIIETDGLTEGAACSVLLAKEYINNDTNLLIANSDQYVVWDPNVFMYSMSADKIDGGIATFTSTHPKWSYAKLDNDGFVKEVAEKIPISTHASVGIYFWSKGSDFVKYAEQMIRKNIRVKGEFYVCPVYNEAIQDGKKIKIYDVDKMYGLGVPEDLNYFLKNIAL